MRLLFWLLSSNIILTFLKVFNIFASHISRSKIVWWSNATHSTQIEVIWLCHLSHSIIDSSVTFKLLPHLFSHYDIIFARFRPAKYHLQQNDIPSWVSSSGFTSRARRKVGNEKIVYSNWSLLFFMLSVSALSCDWLLAARALSRPVREHRLRHFRKCRSKPLTVCSLYLASLPRPSLPRIGPKNPLMTATARPYLPPPIILSAPSLPP